MESRRAWWMRAVLVRSFGLPLSEVTCARRGFAVDDPAVRARLERIGAIVVAGQRLALELRDGAEIAAEIERTIEREDRGFASEGAALGLELLDTLLPGRGDRWCAFARGAGAPHAYLLHVGAGLARARLGRELDLERAAREIETAGLDPLLAPLLADGYGFSAGYFTPRTALRPGAISPRVRANARSNHDQGLGRSLWFVAGTTAERVANAVARLEPERHGDLWSGVGLAAAYAGGVAEAELGRLRELAGEHARALAQGVAFAAEARAHAGNPAAHTELACRVFCGRDADEAVAITRAARDEVRRAPGSSSWVDAYSRWRELVRERCADAAR